MSKITIVPLAVILIVFFTIADICLAIQHQPEVTDHTGISLTKDTKNKLFQLVIYPRKLNRYGPARLWGSNNSVPRAAE